MEIEQITRKLRMNEYYEPSEKRSPSPEPIYDAKGRRTNIREVRKRHQLHQRRHELVQDLLKLNPQYKPPADYRPWTTKVFAKIFIPQTEHPDINFVGLLIGPRGKTLKALEEETGTKMIIRGQGSIKEGKVLRSEFALPGANEPLHVFITANNADLLKKGCDKINSIINEANNTPENNLHRQNQMRQLALLNGTWRSDEVSGKCTNCGSTQHKW